MIAPPPKTQRRRKSKHRNDYTKGNDETRQSLLFSDENGFGSKQNYKVEQNNDEYMNNSLNKPSYIDQQTPNHQDKYLSNTNSTLTSNSSPNKDKTNSMANLESDEEDKGNDTDSDDSDYVRNFLLKVMVSKTPQQFKKEAREAAEAKEKEEQEKENTQNCDYTNKNRSENFLQVIDGGSNIQKSPHSREYSHSVYINRDKSYSTPSACSPNSKTNSPSGIGSGSQSQEDYGGVYDKCFDEIAATSHGITLSPQSFQQDYIQKEGSYQQSQNRRVSTGDLRRKSNDEHMYLSNTPYHHHRRSTTQKITPDNRITNKNLSPAFNSQTAPMNQEHPPLIPFKEETKIKKKVNILEILKRGMPVLKYAK